MVKRIETIFIKDLQRADHRLERLAEAREKPDSDHLLKAKQSLDSMERNHQQERD